MSHLLCGKSFPCVTAIFGISVCNDYKTIRPAIHATTALLAAPRAPTNRPAPTLAASSSTPTAPTQWPAPRPLAPPTGWGDTPPVCSSSSPRRFSILALISDTAANTSASRSAFAALSLGFFEEPALSVKQDASGPGARSRGVHTRTPALSLAPVKCLVPPLHTTCYPASLLAYHATIRFVKKHIPCKFCI